MFKPMTFLAPLVGVAIATTAGCANVDVYAIKAPDVSSILGGFQFRVCESKIRFQQMQFVVEGLSGPSKAATETKSFQVAKVGITAQQAERINTVALAIDAMQEQMCVTTRDMALRSGSAYDEYVRGRDARLERVLQSLVAAQGAIQGGKSQEAANAELAKIGSTSTQ